MEDRFDNPNMLFNKEGNFIGIKGGWVFVDPAKIKFENGVPVTRENGSGYIAVPINTKKNGTKILISSTLELPETPGWVWTGTGDPVPGSWYFESINKSIPRNRTGHTTILYTQTEIINELNAYWVGPGQPNFFPTQVFFLKRESGISIPILRNLLKLCFNSSDGSYTCKTLSGLDYSNIPMTPEQLTNTKSYNEHVIQIALFLSVNNNTLNGIKTKNSLFNDFDINKYFLGEYSSEKMAEFSNAINTVLKTEFPDIAPINNQSLNAIITQIDAEMSIISKKYQELRRYNSVLRKFKITLPSTSLLGGKRKYTKKYKIKRRNTKKGSK